MTRKEANQLWDKFIDISEITDHSSMLKKEFDNFEEAYESYFSDISDESSEKLEEAFYDLEEAFNLLQEKPDVDADFEYQLRKENY